jgi:hypothetical protein
MINGLNIKFNRSLFSILLYCFLSSLSFSSRQSNFLILVKADYRYDYYGELKDSTCVTSANGNTIYCTEFDSWSQLIDFVNKMTANLTNLATVAVRTREPSVLTGELNMWQLWDFACRGPLYTSSSTSSATTTTTTTAMPCLISSITLEIFGLKGFDIVSGWAVNADNNNKENCNFIIYSF